MTSFKPYHESVPDLSGHEEGCYDAIKDVGETLRACVPPDMPAWVVGGIAVAPLRPGVDTEMSVSSKQLKVQSKSDLPLLREPVTSSVRTKRDLDVVIGGQLAPSQKHYIHGQLSDAVDGKMPVSVFGFDRAEEELSPQARRHLNMGSFISRRMLPANTRSVKGNNSVLQLYPFQVDVPPGVYDTWEMHLPNGAIIPVMPPITTHMNYFIRSIGGSRPKDQAKLEGMRRELFGYHQPDPGARKAHRMAFREELNSETYQSLGALARTLDRLPREMRLTKKYVRPDVLHPQATSLDVLAAKARAIVLRAGERHEGIVSRVQTDRVQELLHKFVGQFR